MARSKNATALFEVIHTARKPPKASPTGGIPMPKWWFKSKIKTNQPMPVETKALAAHPQHLAKQVVETVIEQPVYIERPIYIDRPVYVDRPVVIDRLESDPTQPAIESPVSVDKRLGEIKFNLSYAGAVAAGLIIVVVLAIAFLAGTRSPQVGFADEGRPASKNGSAVPTTTGAGFLAAVTPEAVGSVANHTAIVTSTATPAVIPPKPTSIIPDKVVRQVGLNYVIAQSWASEDITRHACEALNKAGIACTVMKSPSIWAAHGWYSVVSVKGFDHVQRNPELETYKQAIEDVGVKFAGNKMFNRFNPLLYKWRPESDQAE